MLDQTIIRGPKSPRRGSLAASGLVGWFVWMGIFLAFKILPAAQAQDLVGEYQKKAIFIGKLARYVEWPKEKMETGVPLVIGVFGADNATDQIREVVSRQKINGRDVVVKHCATVQEIVGCHILFVSNSEEARLSAVLGKVRGDPVLTVGECDTFIKKGGIINLRANGREVTMEYNLRNAKRSDVKLNPLLFNLGEVPAGG